MKQYKYRLALVATALIVVGLGALFCLSYERQILSESKSRAIQASDRMALSINQSLTQNLNATYALAALIKEGNGSIHDFDGVGKEFLALYPGISALQLAPDGVIKHVVPLEGNGKAIGHNLLADEKRNKEALLAIRTGKLTLAGPFSLIQGGEAVVGRLPIFLGESAERFWGFSTALLKMGSFLETTSLGYLPGEGYSYKLWRVHPDTGEPHVFAKSEMALNGTPVTATIDVPNGQWFLSLTPINGWLDASRIAIEAFLVALGAGLACWVVYRELLSRSAQQDRARVLRESRDVAAAANRAKSVILANLSHEICTPLNGMMGMAELLDLPQMSEADQGNLKQLKLCGLSLQMMLERILDYSKLQGRQAELAEHPFNLAELLHMEIRSFQSLALEKGITLSMADTSQLPEILIGDGKRLQQVLHELLDNAISVTSQGTVTLSCHASPDTLGHADACYTFVVSDMGNGIAIEHSEHVFEAFSQASGSASRRYGGIGLGLAICRSIVGLMGGHIEFRSTLGVGSVFQAVLPFRSYNMEA